MTKIDKVNNINTKRDKIACCEEINYLASKEYIIKLYTMKLYTPSIKLSNYGKREEEKNEGKKASNKDLL